RVDANGDRTTRPRQVAILSGGDRDAVHGDHAGKTLEIGAHVVRRQPRDVDDAAGIEHFQKSFRVRIERHDRAAGFRNPCRRSYSMQHRFFPKICSPAPINSRTTFYESYPIAAGGRPASRWWRSNGNWPV